MKALKYFFLMITMVGGFAACDLDTLPTDKLDSTLLPQTQDGCMAILNGVYRGFYTTQYSVGYPTENFGPSAINIASDLMGEDMFMRSIGSAWFFYDHAYWGVRSSINDTSNKPYALWNMMYQYINNANVVLAGMESLDDDSGYSNSIIGQAYALRAYAYFELARWYQRTYVGNEDAPGVPIYTTPTTKDTPGKPRGTLKDVYSQINSDLKSAIFNLEDATPQVHKSQIDLYVAYGLMSRVALEQGRFADAADAAGKALSKPGLTFMTRDALLDGFNTVESRECMWGSEIYESQATSWDSFFSIMDAQTGGYAEGSNMLISKWLYNRIPETDVRKQWFVAPTGMSFDEEDESLEPQEHSLNQLKFRVKKIGAWADDYIYMRAGEMVLNRAEGLVRQENPDFATARELLISYFGIRFENPDEYAQYLATLTDDATPNLVTAQSGESPVTLMDEILLQRRIELWGEGFRIHDINRFKVGFIRTCEDADDDMTDYLEDPSDLLFDLDFSYEEDSWEPIMQLPIYEFNGNKSLDINEDQNP